MSKRYWVYILLCNNQSYYTGYTDNIEKRVQAHISGKGSKYTRSFKPLKIAQCWLIEEDKLLALKLEREIKKRTHKQKMHLILNPSILSTAPQVKLVSTLPEFSL